MEQECHELRIELKGWEKSFAAANGGRKAGREDIKQHPEIGTLTCGGVRSIRRADSILANKYKLYNKLRAGETARPVQTALPAKDQSRKRHAPKLLPASTQTPQKRSKHSQPSQDLITIPEQACSSPNMTPVAHRKSIGPTPQKNGRVLGLFDLLTPSSTFRTPSKRQSLALLPANVVGTPSRAQSKEDMGEQAEESTSITRRIRSPPSASKRAYLASFLTPSTRRMADAGNTPEAATSVSKLRFDDTPAFLRRDSQRFSQRRSLDAMIENEDDTTSWSPVAVRVMRPKPAGRGLSALVKGLREMEEAKLDEELDILREMEGGEISKLQSQFRGGPEVCVEDSQIPDMPLGPDGEGDSQSEDLEALEAEGNDRNGRPLKVWKKKGQKRTTRRVTIKPNTAKWKPEPEWKGGKENESEEEVAAVEETQFVATASIAGAESDAGDFQTDEDNVSEGDFDKGGPQAIMNSSNKTGQRGKPKKAQKDPPKEKKKKKISATAHANFRALKIKNKNTKAKGRGRFGRRR